MAKVIAEIGINHNGKMELAKELIETAYLAGADYVKFQMRDVDTVYAGELDKPRESEWGTTQGEQKRGLEFSLEQYQKIDTHCRRLGIPWFASCWDPKSLHQAEVNFDFPYHKIASAMVTNLEFVEAVARLGRPVIMSTGGCALYEIESAYGILLKRIAPRNITVMHCVAQYPCPDSELNLKVIHTLKNAYSRSRIGYSGHEIGLYPSIMAMAMGAEIIERHITLDRAMVGSDHAASVEPEGLRKLCDVAHSVTDIMGTGVKKILPGESACMRKLRYWEK